ncbi:MAG: ABC transporter ATP-binding protein [Thermoguttaceae bacterium]|jgi:ABC-type lipoprotein export system ATPase subunit|nr:ABC transporter ATP-binding protein [Thermoguttaceae bacterium]
MLEASGLTKQFSGPNGTVTALSDVSLRAEPGEFLAVQGPSGCGKTTLMMILGALLRPTAGEVRIDGEDPYRLSPEARSRFRAERIGFVFQEFYLVPYLSVLENIMAPSLARPHPNPKARAYELIDHFQLADRAAHVPAALSTGERQRVALARALFHDPKLLLADEPTGNLDAANAERVLSYLTAFAQSGGTVLMVTHHADAAGYAHRALEMASGTLAPTAAGS